MTSRPEFALKYRDHDEPDEKVGITRLERLAATLVIIVLSLLMWCPIGYAVAWVMGELPW